MHESGRLCFELGYLLLLMRFAAVWTWCNFIEELLGLPVYSNCHCDYPPRLHTSFWNDHIMLNFALVGASGYIAPRHLKAIKDTGNNLIAAFDPSDNVGILDSYFTKSAFFTVFEKFEAFLDESASARIRADYISVVSPNDLHAAHIRFGLRRSANVICEKPLVLEATQLEQLRIVENETGKRVNTILQLRLHPNVLQLKSEVEQALLRNPDKQFDVDLAYITSRGPWYFQSWKGDTRRSGGIATNIGIHFFDMLGFVFGHVKESRVVATRGDAASGILEFRNARVRWFLSINDAYVPEQLALAGKRTFRAVTVDGVEFEFSDGFTELHTMSYAEIIAGNGFGLGDAEASVRLAEAIRTAPQTGLVGEYHPLAASLF